MPYLSRITIYPVKSLEGYDVDEATVLPGGALDYDRRFAIRDAAGKWVNGKRTDDVHRLRSSFDLASRTLELRIGDNGHSGLASKSIGRSARWKNGCRDTLALRFTWSRTARKGSPTTRSRRGQRRSAPPVTSRSPPGFRPFRSIRSDGGFAPTLRSPTRRRSGKTA